jgi:Ca2+-binding RTX toxin-like protein
MAAPEEILRVQEVVIPESVEFVEVNGIPGTNGIGEGPMFTANWYAADADLSDDQSDPILATTTSQFNTFAQLGDGTFVGRLEATTVFADGDRLESIGFLEPNNVEAGGTEIFQVVDSTGRFAGLRLIEEVTLGSVGFQVRLLSLPQIDSTSSRDYIKGSDSQEWIRGDRGLDWISGGDGNDLIEGEAGGDFLSGGAGDDLLAADRLDRTLDLGIGLSILKGDDGNDTLLGGKKSDLIFGGKGDDLSFGEAGNDLILGGSGFDLLDGGLGNDTLLGQEDIDVASYLELTFEGVPLAVAGVEVNLKQGRAVHSGSLRPLAWHDKLAGIENVIGTTRNDRFIGNEESNVFYGLDETVAVTEFVSLDGESYQVAGDVVEYAGSQSQFSFGISDLPFAGLTVSGPGTETDILIGIEFIRFKDELVPTEAFSV